jgi:taurine dioxygenase
MSLKILVTPLPCLGVEIKHINLAKEGSTDNVGFLTDMLNRHHLLVLREQKLVENQLIDVSKIFGKPVPALVPTHRLENFPVITRHTNSKNENHIPLGVVAPEYVFHSDSYFTANPSKVTLLYSIKAPKQGGETCFVDMCMVYESLSDTTKATIANMRVVYKNAYINQPNVVHPMVRVHPVTHQRALFINKHRAIGIEGMDAESAVKLIQELYDHATQGKHIYKHVWRSNDLLVWNNPTTMHCATPIADTQERFLYRILTEGDFPVV